MICKHCKTKNKKDAAFCSKCGERLEEKDDIVQINTDNKDKVEITVDTKLAKNIFKYLLEVCTKPFTATKSVLKEVTNIKSAGILSAVVIGIMVVVNLLVKMVSCVFTYKYVILEGSKTVIDFSQIGKLDYFGLIFKNLLIYALVVLAITVVYYISSLVVKKEINFSKLLVITIDSLIPATIVGILVYPIVKIVLAPIAEILVLIAIVYSIIILISNINSQIEFKDNNKMIYFHVVCLGMLICLGYLVMASYTNTIMYNPINNIN